jgi:Cu-processing system permease protein
MRAIGILAWKEIRDGLRNRWVLATIVMLTALALLLSLVGSAPTGTVRVSALAVTVASLSSLTVYLVPLIALMLAYDALVGEFERGTMLLLLTYPVARWQVVAGKFLGHMAILTAAILIGYGGAGLVVELVAGGDPESRVAYLAMMGGAIGLSAVFVALGYLLSALARERAMAAGLAVALWLVVVVLYDLALLGLLLTDTDQSMSQGLVALLMLLNPTDAYRLLSLAGSEAVRITLGLTEGDSLGTALPLVSLGLWLLVPLLATTALFQRRDV